MADLLFKWLMITASWFSPEIQAGKDVRANVSQQTVVSNKLLNDNVIHPFYVSVTEINLNSVDKTLEISCKMFTEDLEEILEKNNKTILDITVEKDKSAFDKYIPDYVAKNLVITVDGKPVKLTYIGFEREKESVYSYFQVDNISSVKKIDISNSILYDFNENEINIMHVTINGNRKSTKVNFPEKSVSLSW
ncbi:MAG: DUF6702 family protein [Flavisolibacter sp.]